jgi:antitoxin ParD1/3/4
VPSDHNIYWYQQGVAAMGKHTSFALGEHFSTFIEEQIADGRYGNASEVVRAGLRLLEEREAKLKALRDALSEGEQSGPGQPLDLKSFRSRARADLFDICDGRAMCSPTCPMALCSSTYTGFTTSSRASRPKAFPIRSARSRGRECLRTRGPASAPCLGPPE